MEIARRFPAGAQAHAARVPSGSRWGDSQNKDRALLEAFSAPASVDCIMAHLIRMSAILHIKGAGKDDDGSQSLFLLSDFTTRLHAEKVLEVDLFLACEYFIETEETGFFPTYAKILKQLGKVGV
jgi:hypothetical protein